MRILTRVLLPLLLLCGFAAHASERTIIVLDASGSMWGQIDGKPKLEIARQALKTVLQSLPVDRELGLIAYGHREKGSCDDIELIVPPAAGTAGAITAAADNMKFLGKTPLSAAVKQAAEDLKYTEDKATVILITDGLETCNADPCALGKELEKNGVDFTAHVVGFGLTAEEGRKVACLAENTGGKYIQASDEAALEEALKVTVAAPPAAPQPAPAPEPAPEPAKVEINFAPEAAMKEGGAPLQADGQVWRIYKANADGTRGDDVTVEYNIWKGSLEPGDYIVEAELGYAKAEQKVTIVAGKVASPRFNLNAGTVLVKPRPSPGADVDNGATLRIRYPGADSAATEYGERKLVLPAGEQQLEVQIGEGKVSETFQLAAGQTLEKDVFVGVGHLVVNGFYTPGNKADASGISVKIYRTMIETTGVIGVVKAAKNADGTLDEIAYGFGPDMKTSLPPGEYLVELTLDAAKAEELVSIKVGERAEARVILNAGVVSISAPGAEGFKIYEARKDIQGQRKDVTYGWGEKMQTTLTAGDYVIITSYKQEGQPAKETPVTVKAGERLEVKVE